MRAYEDRCQVMILIETKVREPHHIYLINIKPILMAAATFGVNSLLQNCIYLFAAYNTKQQGYLNLTKPREPRQATVTGTPYDF